MPPQRAGSLPAAAWGGCCAWPGADGAGDLLMHSESAGCGWSSGPVFPGFAKTTAITGTSRVSWWITTLKRSASSERIIKRIWSLVRLPAARAWMSNCSVLTHPGNSFRRYFACILQIGLSGKGMSEQQLNDLGLNFIRPQLATIPGASIPLPYGGKVRQVMVDIDSHQLMAKGLSPLDVVNAVNAQNVILQIGRASVRQIAQSS